MERSELERRVAQLEAEVRRLKPKGKFGDEDNYSEFDDDGTLVFTGDATVWDDIANSLIGKRLYSVVGKVNYNYPENTITFEPGGAIATENDLIRWNQQFPHAAKANSSLYFHLHLEQTSALDATFTLHYRIQSNDAAKTAGWTALTASLVADGVFAYSAGTLNQILAFAAIDMTGASISATIQFKMTRTDNGAGVYEPADIEVVFADCHVEYDMIGSSEQYVK